MSYLPKLNEIEVSKDLNRSKKRLGRGESSGLGKTSGRGHKGQKARSGGYHKVGFEGGQMPLQRRLPKRGFRSLNKKLFCVMNLDRFDCFEKDAEIDLKLLKEKGLVKKNIKKFGLKILGNGELKNPLTIKAHHFSKSALEKIEKAGGTAVLIESPSTKSKEA